jgi:hypothetical protein
MRHRGAYAGSFTAAVGTVIISRARPAFCHRSRRDGTDSASRSGPDFSFRSLRGNAVLRWEYRPGSTLYLVWTRSSASSLSRGTIDFGTDADALFRGPAENIFLLKVNFWLGM